MGHYAFECICESFSFLLWHTREVDSGLDFVLCALVPFIPPTMARWCWGSKTKADKDADGNEGVQMHGSIGKNAKTYRMYWDVDRCGMQNGGFPRGEEGNYILRPQLPAISLHLFL